MSALHGVKILEFAGVAPAPFAAVILSDFGASITRVDPITPSLWSDLVFLGRGKRSLAIDLKKQSGKDVVKKICSNYDVLLESFRPGVMEKLGLGPKVLMKENPALIYARLTGFGQDGPLSEHAGHDINYFALSGVLSMIGRKNEKPLPPLNFLADFAGGSFTCTMGILLALFERSRSGKGQLVDSAMVHGVNYLSTFVYETHKTMWSRERGENLLDSGAPFYDVYQTADGGYMSVGALEPQFFKQLIKGLGLEEDAYENYVDPSNWSEMREKFTEIFLAKTRDEWCEIFQKLDGCVVPVLKLSEAVHHPHNIATNIFMKSARMPGEYIPAPAPKLSRTPGYTCDRQQPLIGQHTKEILLENNFTEREINDLENEAVISCTTPKSSL